MLSVVYIVKNEAKKISASLNSVKFANEVIVIDTGSTDNTIDVITRWMYNYEGNFVLESFKWTGSFADARNYGISLISNDWYLILDADEVLAQGDIDKLINDKDVDIWSCIQLNKDGQMCQTLRLARRGVKYKDSKLEDEIHEQLDTTGWRKGKSDLIIHHLKDLTPEEHHSKVMWILDTIDGINDGSKKDFYQGIYHIHTGEHKKGIEALNRCISNSTKEVRAFIRLVVAKHYLNIAQLYDNEARETLERCVKDSPEQNEGYMQLANYWYNKGRTGKALQYIKKVFNRKNRYLSDLQNDIYYTNNQLQLKEVEYGIISN